MRKVADCREMPSESNCSLTISGEEDEVLLAATAHAVAVHGHEDGPELRDGIRAMLRPEAAGRVDGYGTTMVGAVRPGAGDKVLAALEEWERDRHVPGFLGAQLQLADDGRTLVNTAVFTDREAYRRLADDPIQAQWWNERMAPLLDGEPQWTDGTWQVAFRQPTVAVPQQGAPAPVPART